MENKVEMVKIEVELTKDHVEAMENFLRSNPARADQTVKEFVEELIRRSWGDHYASLRKD